MAVNNVESLYVFRMILSTLTKTPFLAMKAAVHGSLSDTVEPYPWMNCFC